MSDDETSTRAPAAASNSLSTPASSQATVSRPQVTPPPPLNLADCSAKSGSSGNKPGLTSLLYRKFPQYQKALFLCTIGQGALEIFNTFQYSEGEDPNNVDTIISKIEKYFTGEINETYERFKFNKRNQEDGKAFNAYLTAL